MQVAQVEVLWWNKLRQPARQGCLEAEKKKAHNLFTILFMPITLTN